MLSKGQRIILLGSLGVGYFFYRDTLRRTIANSQTVSISIKQAEELQFSRFSFYEGQKALISHPVNSSKNRMRKRVLIIGGGLTGIATAFFLSKHPNIDTILIDQDNDLATRATAADNGCFTPSASYPLINSGTLPKLLGGTLRSSDWSVNLKAFILEKYIGTWFLNAFPSFIGVKAAENQQSLSGLGSISMNVLDNMKEQIELAACGYNNKGTAVLSEKEIKIGAINDPKIDVLYQLNGFEPPINENFKGAIIFRGDRNLDSQKFALNLANSATDLGTVILNGTNFLKFLRYNENGEVCGIITSSGAILADAIVIAAGYNSKKIINDLGLRIPLLPLKSYTLDFPSSSLKTNLIYNLSLQDMSATLTQLEDTCRLSGCFDIDGPENTESKSSRVDFLTKKLKSIFKNIENPQNCIPRSEIFSLTSDDMPIVGNLPYTSNIYLNTGHGRRGAASALGASKLLADQIADSIDGKSQTLLDQFSINRFYLV